MSEVTTGMDGVVRQAAQPTLGVSEGKCGGSLPTPRNLRGLSIPDEEPGPARAGVRLELGKRGRDQNMDLGF
jgi:hypothetical protein